MVATRHFLDYVEFLYYLQEVGYDDYMTSDTSPTRWDIKGTFEANARVTNRIWNKLNALDGGAFGKLIAERDYLATWRFIEEKILALG
jgi:xylose isomerase